MLNISDKLKRSLESFGDKKSIKIKLGDLDITSDLISQSSVKLDQGLSSKDNYSIGNTICSELNFSIINNKNKYTNNSFFNKEVTVQVEIETSTGEILELNCGTYICQRPTISNSGKIDIKAYDKMMKLDINSDAFLNTLNYPISLTDFLKKACNYVGIECNIASDIVNGDFKIKSRPESQKFTLRELVGMALQIAGGNGRINISNNNFEVVYLTETNYTIPESVHFDVISIEDYLPAQIECVVASNKENKDIVYGERSGFVYYIDGNELFYSSTDEEILNALGRILGKLSNIVYNPYSISIKRGLIFLQPGDIISFTYNGKTYKGPILDRTLDGLYLSDEISASGSEDRDKLRQSTISSGQVSGMISSGVSAYNLISTHRYLDETGSTILAMGMRHSNINEELIFKPHMEGDAYLGMETNFQAEITNIDTFGELPDMTEINLVT